tara:strand:- start:28 stop:981 length:954 start_codon:yes stop_codon:yes gene_type:complete
MKLIINIFLFIFILNSCTLENNKQVVNSLIEKKQNIIKNIENKDKKEKKQKKERKQKKEKKQLKTNVSKYVVGDSYFIQGVEHIPQEDYYYNKNGLATYYGKDLHNIRTANNELNKVTELLGRHKTLPLPSVVRITNLENGLSLIIRVNDRSQDNASIIEVSRKVAQLLRFYKAGIARVRVEIIPDSSKQLKIVTESMNNPNFNITLEASPTEDVFISDLGETFGDSNILDNSFEQPIELGFEQISASDLLVKIEGFDSYNDVQNIVQTFENNYKTTIQKEGNSYSAFFGPLNNNEANKLVQFLISKGYKNAEIVIQ